MSKIEIRQVEGEKIFTEICIDGHKIDGVRGYELKQDKAGFPVLTIDLNAFDIATDLRTLQLKAKIEEKEKALADENDTSELIRKLKNERNELLRQWI